MNSKIKKQQQTDLVYIINRIIFEIAYQSDNHQSDSTIPAWNKIM